MLLKKLQMKLPYIYKEYKNNKIIQAILLAFSFFYLIGYKIRLLLYKIKALKTLSVPATVISIGNLSTGGTGKTQITIELARFLNKNSIKVAILARGYKRKDLGHTAHENILVSDGEEILTSWDISGDEPYLIAKDSPKSIVLSGKNRIKAALSAIKMGAQAIILDDGYQYLKLKRDLNILIIDSTKPLESERLFPAGELRELPNSLVRADAIIFTNCQENQIPDACLSTIKKFVKKELPLISMHYKIKEIKGINITKKMEAVDAKKLKFIAFSGIGNPESFTKTLKAEYLQIIDHIVFNDHNEYTTDDILKLINLALKNNIENLITTEKDAIKINYLCESAPVTFWSCRITPEWNNPEPFQQFLKPENIKSKVK